MNYDDLVGVDQNQVRRKVEEIEKLGLKLNGTFVSDTSLFYCNNFEEYQSPFSYGGKGALQLEKAKFNFLADLTVDKEMDMMLRFWYYKGKDGLYNAMLFIEETDSVSKTGQWLHLTDAHNFPIIDNEWVLVEIPFHAKAGPYNYKAVIKGDDNAKGFYYIDNLVLAPASTNYFSRNISKAKSNDLFFNNIPIR